MSSPRRGDRKANLQGATARKIAFPLAEPAIKRRVASRARPEATNGGGQRRTSWRSKERATRWTIREPLRETAKDSLRGMADATTDKVKDAAESTHAMASNVAEEVREYAEEAQTEAGQVFYGQKQFRSSMEKNLKERPVATIAAISLIAFLLGALWKK